MRLWLIGDDEVLDLLAELSTHLDYFQVTRLDSLPEEILGKQDHLVIGFQNEPQGLSQLARALGQSAPGFSSLVPPQDSDSLGARAILVAADLVSALHDA